MSERFVIVGAGSAGCVLASKLARAGIEVVLVEAGPDYPRWPPSDLKDGRHNSMYDHDWGYAHRPTTVQTKFPFPRGKVVGGSSAVNTCIALRPQPYDHAEWVDATGDDAWSYEACLEAYRETENDLDFPDHDEHGSKDGLPVKRAGASELTDWSAAFVEAALEVGYQACDDQNVAGAHGAGPHAMNKIAGQRVSAAEAFLTPDVRALENLSILTNRLVHRVTFERDRATGVQIEYHGQLTTLEGRVVLCAGAVSTPGVLLRSGVGSPKDVARVGAAPLIDNPWVAKQLLDHPGVAFFVRKRWGGPQTVEDPLIQTVLRYGSAQHADRFPNDIQIQPGSKIIFPPRQFRGGSLMSAIGKPFGKGVIRFTSSNPRSSPFIDSRLLEDERDKTMAVEALTKAYELVTRPVMAKLAKPFYPPTPILRDPARLRGFIRWICDSGYHPCGTAPMADTRHHGACDSTGRVFGARDLWVADASLMPTVPSSNTNIATLMIGARIADFLLA